MDYVICHLSSVIYPLICQINRPCVFALFKRDHVFMYFQRPCLYVLSETMCLCTFRGHVFMYFQRPCVYVLSETMCLCTFRDHVFQKLLPLMASAPITAQMYEENSFLRNLSHTNYLVHILGTLDEFQITLETSLLRGLEI